MYAVTASDGDVSSWASYCAPDDVVNGVAIGSCLGDLFSTNWMENSESTNIDNYTIEEQFEFVKAATTESPVQEFGDFSVKPSFVGEFQGIYDGFTPAKKWYENYLPEIKNPFKKESRKSVSNVSSRDVKLNYLYKLAERNGGEEAHKELMAEIQHRMDVDAFFGDVFSHHDANEMVVQPEDFDCFRFMMNNYEESCGKFSDYSLKYVKHLVHACETESPAELNNTAIKITERCNNIA